MAAKPVILCVWDGLAANQATLQVFIFSSERSCGIQKHLLRPSPGYIHTQREIYSTLI